MLAALSLSGGKEHLTLRLSISLIGFLFFVSFLITTFSPYSLNLRIFIFLKCTHWDFPGGLELETLPSSAGGTGSILDEGANIPHAS